MYKLHFSDTIYTERYMDLPEKNIEGYVRGSILKEEAVSSNLYLINLINTQNFGLQDSAIQWWCIVCLTYYKRKQ